MKKAYLVGLAITGAVLEAAKKQFPDMEIVTVDKESEIKKAEKAMFGPEPVIIKDYSRELMPEYRIHDMKAHNPYPEPHRSSKRSRKY